MIHYHGTPLGGKRQDAVPFLSRRHAFVSFYRPEDLGIVQECCQSFALDNGAFSHWKAGKGEIDVAAYYDWVKSIAGHPGLDWAIIPDVIDGHEAQNKQFVADWLSDGPVVEGVPVWHMHESLDYLDYLASDFRTVAIGSSGQWETPGTTAWWTRMSEAMEVACDSYGKPRARLHGLRMLAPDVFRRLPLSSADSTNAARHGNDMSRFGTYLPPTRAQRMAVIAERVEAYNSAAVWVDSPQDVFDFG